MPDLPDIPVTEIEAYQNRAMFRLHLYFTGKTHELFVKFLDEARGILNRYTGPDGQIDVVNLFTVVPQVETAWTTTFNNWGRLFEEGRYQSAAIPYGALALRHHHFMGLLGQSQERRRRFNESGEFGNPFEGQLQGAMNYAASQQYADGLTLSRRIWRLGDDSTAQIRRIVTNGIATGTSAWDMAKELESELGAGQDCPRWTRDRLMNLTKRQIAQGDVTGLISGHPCGSKGVSYNALRLARTEYQVVHNKASLEVMKSSPWVTAVEVNLNPQHPVPDICDERAEGGPYQKNDVPLPPYHPHCLCFLTSVLMSNREFVDKAGPWLNGQLWPEMSQYQTFVGGPSLSDLITPLLLIGAGAVMTRWLWGDEAEMDAPFEAETAALGAVEL